MSELKEKVLAALREQRCEGAIQRLELRVLEMMVESEFASDHVGTLVDERGVQFGYIFLQSAYFPELSGELFSGIFVTRIFGSDASFLGYARQQLEHVAVLDEEQKKVCLCNIEAAAVLRTGKGIGERLEH